MIKNAQYRQVKVSQGQKVLVTNVPDHKGLKVGNFITLPEENEEPWKLEWVADSTRPKSALNRGWNNNI
jgi:hypothetical protein